MCNILLLLLFDNAGITHVMCYYDHNCPFVLDHIAECRGGVCEYTPFLNE